MFDKRFWLIITLSLILAVSLGTANRAFSDEDSSGGTSGLTARMFGKDRKNWKEEKEARYKKQFKGNLFIGDKVERIDFSKNYVEIYHTELNDKPTVMFICRTNSGKDLLDIIYDENDMYKYHNFQRMDEEGKRKFLQDSFAKYEVILADPQDQGLKTQAPQPVDQAAISNSNPPESPATAVASPAETLTSQAAVPQSEELSIEERLIRLNSLKEKGLISPEEYVSIRKKILSDL